MQDVDDVAAYILQRYGAVEAMKLQKLLYYSQAWFGAVFGRELFTDQILGFRDGPVVESVFRKHKGSRTVRSWPGDPAALDDAAKDIVDLVCVQYGNMSGDELSDLSHYEKPWKDSRIGLAAAAPGRRVISVPSMAAYYRASRTLGGRYAADLSAGGIAVMGPAMPAEAPALLRELLAAVRNADPIEPIDDDYFGRGQFEQANDSGFLPSRRIYES